MHGLEPLQAGHTSVSMSDASVRAADQLFVAPHDTACHAPTTTARSTEFVMPSIASSTRVESATGPRASRSVVMQ